eukprot:CAMPEP_0178920454 /NCGR_PEP_ID=MMETSP0786-20121207/15013_1 /TAXON_ID=186022 /ORGANISM="Thalassionema frauenfeldii, Strain CCMP 1798" /LENGTH=121 /DNA_ID=CAMNT_0020594521 /DNA_START=363 /DNA_END=728 /DNA_ORIENTATION=+
MFGYLKKYKNRKIAIDSRPLIFEDGFDVENSFHPDFLEDYPDAAEEIGDGLPQPYGQELQTNIFFDADHAHDRKTLCSITGMIVITIGRTPVEWISKRQGCIATSTYCAEFIVKPLNTPSP